MTPPRWRVAAVLAVVALALAGCATPPIQLPEPAPPAQTAAERTAIEDRILALDPEHVDAAGVRTLARGPTPRIVLLHGGIYPVHLAMESFAVFLVRMGYPEARIRDPGTGDWTYSCYEDSEKLAGLIAWQYERDAMRPLLIGHSQGGMQAVKVLRELAGKRSAEIAVFNAEKGVAEPRTTIRDPFTGATRPVVGLSVAYASAVGAGGLTFILPNQWSMIGNLRLIPDSVDEFTGFNIGNDMIAWTTPDDADSRWRENGTAKVRSVELPSSYSHVMAPVTADLPTVPETRAWIEAYAPDHYTDPSKLPGDAKDHALWAADVWYSVKKHWALEAQRLIRARRAGTLATPVG